MNNEVNQEKLMEIYEKYNELKLKNEAYESKINELKEEADRLRTYNQKLLIKEVERNDSVGYKQPRSSTKEAEEFLGSATAYFSEEELQDFQDRFF